LGPPKKRTKPKLPCHQKNKPREIGKTTGGGLLSIVVEPHSGGDQGKKEDTIVAKEGVDNGVTATRASKEDKRKRLDTRRRKVERLLCEGGKGGESRLTVGASTKRKQADEWAHSLLKHTKSEKKGDPNAERKKIGEN